MTKTNTEFKTIWTPTKNFYSGDFNVEPEIHILHGTMAELSSALPWLQGKNGNKNSSAHFVYGRKGTVYNLADIKKRTFHSGVLKAPNEKARNIVAKFGKNPNKYSCGHEIVIKWGEQYSDEQVQAFCDTYEYLHNKYEWKRLLNDDRLVMHRDFHTDKPDLSASRERIIKELKKRNLWEDVVDIQTDIPEEDRLSVLDKGELIRGLIKDNPQIAAFIFEWAKRIVTWYIKNKKA